MCFGMFIRVCGWVGVSVWVWVCGWVHVCFFGFEELRKSMINMFPGPLTTQQSYTSPQLYSLSPMVPGTAV